MVGPIIQNQKDTWVGQSIPRSEDATLLTGNGEYIGDLKRPDMLHAVFLRSPYAHAKITSIDTSKALELPGVHTILTGQDLPDDLGPLPTMHSFFEHRDTPTLALAVDRVRYVGEPVAVIAADSTYIAEDAMDLIEVDWEPLSVVASVDAALEPGAALLYDDWPDNVATKFDAEIGDLDAAIEDSDVSITERFRLQRSFGCPLETRGVLAEWDFKADTLEFWTSSQILHQARDYLAATLNHPTNRIRVRIPRIGGAFGAKFHFYVEEVAIALIAKSARRPVRWIEDRLESFVGTVHAREQRIDATIVARSDGTITGIKADIVVDMGSMHHTVSMGPGWLTAVMMTNVYLIKNARVSVQAVATNKTPIGSFRGWGQPQANFVVERLVDLLANKLGIDPADIRRKNFIPPELFPYTSLHHTFDSGRYQECLDNALEKFGYEDWRTRQKTMHSEGRVVGVGLAFHVENTALGPSRMLNEGACQQGGYDISRVRMESNGTVTIYSGLCEMGQGYTNAFRQICADALGINPDDVLVVTGDSEYCPYTGYGTGASRSATVGGASLRKAAGQMREKIARIAAHMLQSSPDKLEFANRRVSVKGHPGNFVSIADVAKAAYHLIINLPDDLDPGLEEIAAFDPPQMAWPYGVNLAVIEIDPGTGAVDFLDYAMFHDSGTLLNPMIIDGQIHGGVAQGVGQALFEKLYYDEEGQLMSGSFMDYMIPGPIEVPHIQTGHTVTPSPIIPGGTKGVGEASIIGSPSAIVNAIEDALRPYNPKITEMPVTPEQILAILRAGKAGDQ